MQRRSLPGQARRQSRIPPVRDPRWPPRVPAFFPLPPSSACQQYKRSGTGPAGPEVLVTCPDWPPARLLLRSHLRRLRLIVSPRTPLRWHAGLVRQRCAHPRRVPGRPRTAQALRALAREMARDSPSWATAVSMARRPAWDATWRRQRYGRFSRTPASIPHQRGPGRPGSIPGRPGHDHPRRGLLPAATCMCCSSSGTAGWLGTWRFSAGLIPRLLPCRFQRSCEGCRPGPRWRTISCRKHGHRR